MALANICTKPEPLLKLFTKVKEFLRKNGKLLIVEPFSEDFDEFEKLRKVYELSGLIKEECIHSLEDVLETLLKCNFKPKLIEKHEFSWRPSKEEFLEYFELEKLPFSMQSYYFFDKPRKVTIIICAPKSS